MRKPAAALVAIICWAGLALQLWTSSAHGHHLVATLWVLARFFTIVTNLLAAVLMTWIATGHRASPALIGAATLSLLLVGFVYGLLLRGLHPLAGPPFFANLLLHDVAPAAMGLWWLLFAPRNRLHWDAPWMWAAYPLGYVAYVFARARLDGRYPYPFIDVARIGWTQSALNVGGISLAFLLCGFLLVWIDKWRPVGSRQASA